VTKRIILILLIPLLAKTIVLAQSNRSKLIRTRLEPMIEETMRQHQIPGFAIGIVDNGKVIYARGFGVAKLGSNNPITPKSLFHMASVTKPFVATAIMQLVERGKISLDARVIEYLPYFRMKDKRFATITVRQMLNHISGMPDVEDYNWDKPEYDDGALERYVRGLNNLSLLGAPGEKFRYSNIAFEVLGDVIAKVSGMSFESYVQQNILAPLGMKHSTLLVRETNPKRLVAPHIPDKDGKVIVSKVFPYNRPHAPSSTLYSSVDDMNRWARANLNRGELDGKRILKASSYDVLWKSYADVGEISPLVPSDMKIGLSWFLRQHNGHRLVNHGGGDRGFHSFLLLAPDDSISVVAMSNYSSNTGIHVYDIADAAINMMLSESFIR
jgi:CubicO group peptidase (beta-lactamase class C family)